MVLRAGGQICLKVLFRLLQAESWKSTQRLSQWRVEWQVSAELAIAPINVGCSLERRGTASVESHFLRACGGLESLWTLTPQEAAPTVPPLPEAAACALQQVVKLFLLPTRVEPTWVCFEILKLCRREEFHPEENAGLK